MYTATRFPVSEYGDAAETPATAAFQGAIDACVDAGGGTVTVPPGEYVIGTIHLGSNVTLRLESGATVSPVEDETEYSSAYVGPDNERVFVLAEGVENVSVTGRGTFDGRGTEFMCMDTPIRGHSNESEAHPLISNGPHRARQGEDFLDPADGTDDWPVAKPDFRPGPMFRFSDCTDVLVRDVSLVDMPAWTLSFHGCAEVDVRGVDILNHMLIPNCDGVSITDSRNVHVSDCTIRSCDDSVTLNAHADREMVCENVTLTNCTLASSACAIKFGSGTDDTIRNCLFQNCTIDGSNRGLGIQHRDSGDIENVLFSDVVIDTYLRSGPWWGKAEPIYVTSIPRDDETDLGAVRNVRFSNVVASGESGALVYGSEESTIENLRFDDVRIEVHGSENAGLVGGNFDLQPTSTIHPIFEHDVPGVHCENVSGLELRDVEVVWGDDLPAYHSNGLQCVGVSDLEIDGFVGRQAHPDGDDPAVRLESVETVTVRDSRARPGTDTFLDGDGIEDSRLLVGNDLADAETPVGDGAVGFETAGNRPSL